MQRSPPPVARVVLLGASNLTFGLQTAAAAARERFGGALEILAAPGCGRSYGVESRLLGRALPGIVDCGLWPALAQRPPRATFALLTDFGNDLGYGSRAAEVAPWVERCVERLLSRSAEVVLTGLPLASLRRMPPWEFRFWASVLFAFRRIERQRLLAEAGELQERLAELARTHSLALVETRLAWYGRDPIHVRRAHRAEAWREYVGAWKRLPVAAGGAAGAARRSGRLWYEQVRIFGVQAGRAQPCARLDDGSAFSLY